MTRTMKAMLASLVGLTLLAAPAAAVVVPQSSGKEFRHPGLTIPSLQTPAGLSGSRDQAQLPDLSGLGVPPGGAFYDPLARRWASLLPSEPLIPGTGVGNQLTWAGFGIAGRPTEAQVKSAAWEAFVAYLQRTEALNVDVGELSRNPRLAVFDDGTIVQTYVQRVLAGYPVRDSSIAAVINHGNLVLLGLTNWAEAAPVADPSIGADSARAVVAAHASPALFTGTARPRLEFVPFAPSGDAKSDGYEYRLMWVVEGRTGSEPASWEGLVDAANGELLAFQDKNRYASVKHIQGGVFPVSNDGTPPDGVEAPGFPMPFATVTFPGGSARTSNTGGVLGCVAADPGPGFMMKTQLTGPYVTIADVCGLVRENALLGSELPFELGFGPGTDCVVPSGHSAGDTHASRTAFYEVNRIVEQARGYLPGNDWLRSSLLVNLNINNTCNAFWNGVSINFYRDNGSQCRNTGEIAAVFDHEWGHGLDDNGLDPSGSNPGEAIADVHSILRLNDSCMGRGFFKTGNCGGYGDACTACSGVRDLDFARHRCNLPHTLTWITSGFPVAQCNPAAPACPAGGGPCNREVHCEGYPIAETGWDLFARDLRAAPFSFDLSTALEINTRLWYLGSQLVDDYYQCTPPFGGCPATGGYMQVLAADDDNGNINDGTPHMTAIFAAFNRHEVACATPAVVNSGCAGGPVTAPTLTVTPRDQGANLTWTAVPGAARYGVYRTEGVRGCEFGKVKLGETTGLTFEDNDIRNGFGYYYSVLPIGTNAACFGLMSNCQLLTPAPGPNVRALPPAPIQAIGGDNDGILDNCETARLTVSAENNGIAPLTNVRVIAAASATHPLTLPSTPLPATVAASLAPCGQASGTFDVIPHGMAFNETFEVTLTITADQIAPSTRTVTYRATGVETDFSPVATRTYDFNASMQGWTVDSGTFNRVDAGGGDFYLASSNCLDEQCDVVRSPVIRLTGTSTLSLSQRYDTEIPTPTPYDRANVGVFTLDNGGRVAVSPDGGDLYDLPPGAPNGTCGTAAQAGWSADTDADCTPPAGTTGFQASSWTANAINPGGQFTGRSAQLSVNYGTDPLGNGWGFQFDNVVLTNFQEAVPDAQACTIVPAGGSRPARLTGKARAAKR